MVKEKQKFDLCENVTNKIITQLEEGHIPWRKPWVPGKVDGFSAETTAYSRATMKAYRGINQWWLLPGEYATYGQITKAGGHVKRGEKADMVVFWKMLPVKTDPDSNEEITKVIPMLKYYSVFHVATQCEGIAPRELPTREDRGAEPDAIAELVIENYSKRENILIRRTHERDEAYYAPGNDYIQVPTIGQFAETSEYYSTCFHEMMHSTGHKNRLNRGFKTNQHFGDSDYNKEELVAEIGAAMLVNLCGVETEKSFRNNAAYIENWLTALKNDKRMILSASGKADKAVCYILGNDEYELPAIGTA